MKERHVEMVLLWSDAGPSDAVRKWFESRGLAVLPMAAGLLISGPESRVASALSVDLKAPPQVVPVPDDLKPHVASIAVPRPRRFT